MFLIVSRGAGGLWANLTLGRGGAGRAESGTAETGAPPPPTEGKPAPAEGGQTAAATEAAGKPHRPRDGQTEAARGREEPAGRDVKRTTRALALTFLLLKENPAMTAGRSAYKTRGFPYKASCSALFSV